MFFFPEKICQLLISNVKIQMRFLLSFSVDFTVMSSRCPIRRYSTYILTDGSSHFAFKRHHIQKIVVGKMFRFYLQVSGLYPFMHRYTNLFYSLLYLIAYIEIHWCPPQQFSFLLIFPSPQRILSLSADCSRQAPLLVHCQCALGLNQFHACSFEARLKRSCGLGLAVEKHVASVSLGLLLMMSIINMTSDKIRWECCLGPEKKKSSVFS